MIVDIECDGLNPTKIYVLSYMDEDNKIHSLHSYNDMISFLRSCDVLVGHNIIRFDIPVLERLLNIKIKAKLVDTLALSWYLHPSRISHGLDGWGQTLGVEKPKIDDWSSLSLEEYTHRCEEDVKINARLYKQLMKELEDLYEGGEDRLISYLSFKMDCAREQEELGWKLDVDRCTKAIADLEEQAGKKEAALKSAMPVVPVYVTRKRPSKPYRKDGTYSTAGARWFHLLKKKKLPEDFNDEVKEHVHDVEPNPNSVQQIKDWLHSLGWVPRSFNFVDNRKIEQVRVDIDGEKVLCPSVVVLKDKEPAIEHLEGLTVINHRLSILRGFMKNEEDGWLKAEISGLTNTLRFKHKTIVNLPSVAKPWGDVVRGVLIAPDKGYVLCGSDMVSLEDSTKRHYMYEYDPEYVDEMSREGFDPHLDLAYHAGVVTQEQINAYNAGDKSIKPVRSQYKVGNYSCVYGVGASKLARTLGIKVKDAKKIIDTYWERNWSVRKVADNARCKRSGGQDWVYNPVSQFWYSLRSEKDKFSTLNQSTGSFCFDMWVRSCRKRGIRMCGQFHDEHVSPLEREMHSVHSILLQNAIKELNDKLKLNVTLDIDVQYGDTYAQIH